MLLKNNTTKIMVGIAIAFLLFTCAGVGAAQSYTNQTLWKNHAGGTSPIYFGENIYINSESTFAINATNGDLKWQYLTKSTQSSPTYYNDTLYVTGDKVYALNASTGNLKWSYAVSLTSTPTIHNDVLYAGGSKIYALDALTGALRWNYNTISSSTPTAYNGIIYTGSDDGNVYALNSDTGSLIWNYTTGSKVQSSPKIVENVLYIGSQDNYTYALNASTGSLIWKYQTGGAVDSSPSVINGSVYVGSDDEYVYSINSTTGGLNWQHKTDGAVVSSPTVTDDLVFVGSRDSYVYSINATTGNLYWKYRTGSDVISSPVISNGIVYIGSNDHYLYAIGGYSGVTDLDNPYYFDGKKTVCSGERWELNEGYNLTVVVVDANGNKALINLTKNGELLDESIVSGGEQYYYNRSVGITNRIIVNMTISSIFRGTTSDLVQFNNIEQFPDIGTVDTDPTKILKLDHVSNLGNNYSIKLTDIGQSGDKGLLILTKNDSIVDECIVEEGTLYTYKRKNVSSDVLESILEIPIRKMFSSGSGDYIEYSQDYSLYSDVNTVDVEETIIVQQSKSWNLNEGYSLIVEETSFDGNEVLISLNKYGVIVDQQIIEENSTYQYNRFNLTDELNHIILKINVTNVLNGKYGKYVGFSTNYFLSSDDDTIDLLGSKILKSGDRWDIGSSHNLSIYQVDVDGEKAWVGLLKNNQEIADSVLDQSESFEYTSPEWGDIGQNWFKFNGTISGIIRGTIGDFVEFKPHHTINSNVSYKMATADVKVLAENDTWGVNGYNLTAKEVNLSSNKVLLVLNKSESTVKEMYVNNGGTFQYEKTFCSNNVLQYSVNITNVFSGSESSLVQLSNLVVYDTQLTASDSINLVKAPAPSINLSSPSFLTVSNYVNDSQTFTATIDQVVNVTWILDGVAIQTNTSTQTASYYNSSAQLGTHNLTVTAKNIYGTDQKNWTWTVTVPPAPSINLSSPSPPSISNVEGDSATFTTTVDQVSDVTWILDGNTIQTNTSATTASYYNTSAKIGEHNLTVFAENTNGTDQKKWTWIVEPAQTAPSNVEYYEEEIKVGDGYQINNYVIDVTDVFLSDRLAVFKIYKNGDDEPIYNPMLDINESFKFNIENGEVELKLLSVGSGVLSRANVLITIKNVDTYLTGIVNGGHEYANYIVITPNTYTMQLQKGWNLVSTPLTPDTPNVNTLFDSNSDVILPIYSWNTVNKQYYDVSTIEISKGYWILALNDTQVTFAGTPYGE